jgi:hypothetical protein
MNPTGTRIDVAGGDYRRCKVCCQLVPLGARCLCEMVQDSHRARIREARQLAGLGTSALVSGSDPEPSYAESDAQDDPVPMPLFHPQWRTTLLLCVLAVTLGALFVHAIDGTTRRGRSEVRWWQGEAEKTEATR